MKYFINDLLICPPPVSHHCSEDERVEMGSLDKQLPSEWYVGREERASGVGSEDQGVVTRHANSHALRVRLTHSSAISCSHAYYNTIISSLPLIGLILWVGPGNIYITRGYSCMGALWTRTTAIRVRTPSLCRSASKRINAGATTLSNCKMLSGGAFC